MDNLTYIFTNDNFWHNYARPIYQQWENNPYYPYYNTRGRTINETLNRIVNKTSARTLLEACKIITNTDRVGITGHYRFYTSDSIVTAKGLINTSNIDIPCINIVHIAKGISYVKNAIKKPEIEALRIQQAEVFLINDVTHFIRVYKNFPGTTPNQITILTNLINDKLIYKIYTLLPNLFEIYENDTNTVEKNEKIHALRQIFAYLANLSIQNEEKTEESVVLELKQILENFIKLFNFEERNIEQFTQCFITHLDNVLKKSYQNTLESVIRDIKIYEERLIEYYTTKSNTEKILNTLQLQNAEAIDDFKNILKTTKAIEILESNQNRIRLKITAPLQYFISDDLTTLENNPHSVYNARLQEYPTHKKILHKIFVTKEYKITVQSIVDIYLRDSNIQPIQINAIENTSETTLIPNPHLHYYDCWSAAKTKIYQHITQKNYDLMCLQIIAAVQTINIAETQSFTNRFIGDFINPNYTSKIQLTDQEGNIYNLNQILEKESNNETNNIE